MQSKQTHQPELFSTISIESFVPERHILRRYDRGLDLSFIQAKTASLYCEQNGCPSVDPEVFMRLMLLSPIYGIHSDRQLREEIHCNLAYRWFFRNRLEDRVPDHSRPTRIRDQLGVATFQLSFLEIINQCRRLVKGKWVIAEGSLIDANASLYSMLKFGEELDESKTTSKKR